MSRTRPGFLAVVPDEGYSIPDGELEKRQRAAAVRYAEDDEFAGRVNVVAEWAQRVDILRGLAGHGLDDVRYRMAVALAMDTEWEAS